MLPPRLKQLLLILCIVAHQLRLQTSCEELNERAGSEKHQHDAAPEAPSVIKQQGGGSGSEGENIWNMVAELRKGGAGGRGRVEADSSAFSRSLKLEWAIDLDADESYRLNWCANVTNNEIIFALTIGAGKSAKNQFRIGTDIFALGFSERGQLESSDFCLIWYDLSHKLHLQDARTSATNQLELIESGGSVCKLLNHHHALHSESGSADSPVLKAEIDYEDDDAKLDTEQAAEAASERQAVHQARSLDQSAASSAAARGGENLEVVFTRPLEVCATGPDGRASGYYAIDNGTTHLVWFSLRGPLLALDGLNLTEALRGQRPEAAGQWGMRRVQMLAARPSSGQQAKGGQVGGGRAFDVRMDKYEIPAQETTYMCKLFKLPSKFEARRYHITSYEAAIEAGREHVVHHMELFNCANLTPDEQRQLDELAAGSGWAGECGSAQRPAVTQKCKKVILAWAMGARPLVYPDQVGQSIGGPNYSPYVVLEVHYNNVERQAGLADSSGLRFHYSAKLRPYEAGVLEVGLEYTDKNSIPPGLLAPLAGYCVSECTRAAMLNPAAELEGEGGGGGHRRHRKQAGNKQQLEPGIYIFAAQLHTHLTGVASWTEHVRGNKLLGELQRDNHYSPHFQEIRLLAEPVRLAPGDALIHYCLYDTRQRPNVTLGGFATLDEMCVTYLHYYPRIDLEVCKSSVDTRALSDYFSRLQRDERQPTTPLEGVGNDRDQGGQPKSVSENYRSIEWSARRSRELIEFYNLAPLSVQCNRSDGRRWPGEWEGIEPTRFGQLEESFGAELGLGRTGRDLALGEEDAELEGESASEGAAGAPRLKSARELVAYRGFGARRKQARCRPRAPAANHRERPD